MQEFIRLLKAIDETREAGKEAAIATVVRVKGSAYRREGTKMLIDADGGQVCMISGGCLEAEVGEIAKRVMDSGEPVVQFFDLEEDIVWGLGLGCGGAVDVYIEPFDPGEANMKWLKAVKNQRAAALATIISSEGSSLKKAARMFIDEDGKALASLGSPELDASIKALAKEKMNQLYPRSVTKSYALDGKVEVFLDVNVPPPELAIFGAGHDAIPMANFAHTLGYNVSIIDARHVFVSKERFPEAKTLIRSHPSGFAEKVILGPRSYVLIMNHHLERDKDCLAFVLNSPAPYIGVLGPRSRYDQILETLGEEGLRYSPEELARVRNPIGVDIGADTPEEIAVSVLSELLAVRGGYKAGFLNAREGRIHALQD